MPIINFSQYSYYPALTSTDAESIAYGKLSPDDKKSILPIFELSHRRNANSLDEACSVVDATISAAPFILDINKYAAPRPFLSREPSNDDLEKFDRQVERQASYNADLAKALSPANGFAEWRKIVARFPNAVPMIVYTDASAQARQILRQASLLSRNSGSLAIRITPESRTAIIPVLSQILSILESEDRLLIVLDCGQIRLRSRRVESVKFVQETALQILNEIDITNQPLARFVCMSNSYPQLNHHNLKLIDNYDWIIWREASESCTMMFGDYGAHHRLPPSGFIPSGLATVVFPLDEKWLAYRHPDARDPVGWIDGSSNIMKHALYNDKLLAWGHDVIKAAAHGDIAGMESQKFWNAAKINIHIRRQIHFAAANVGGYGGDPDE